MRFEARPNDLTARLFAHNRTVRTERVALVLVVAGVLACAGCKLRLPGSRAAEAREAREAVALAWMNALGASDGGAEPVRRLTAGVLLFRTTGEDRRCEGRVVVDAGFAEWLTCARAKPDLRAFSDALKLYQQALAADAAKNATFKQYLPRIVRGDEAWSRYVGAADHGRADDAFRALEKEAGKDGAWSMVVTSWLYTTMTVRVQVVGAANDPRVAAALVHVHRISD